ncbi:MAG: hypothetical protein ABI574_13870 [Burkholderiales bacterium]
MNGFHCDEIAAAVPRVGAALRRVPKAPETLLRPAARLLRAAVTRSNEDIRAEALDLLRAWYTHGASSGWTEQHRDVHAPMAALQRALERTNALERSLMRGITA